MKIRQMAPILFGVAILAVGVGAMFTLMGFREPPAEATANAHEYTLQVTAVEAIRVDVPTFVSGYGEVRPKCTVTMAPELSGRVVSTHPNLVVGGIVRKGEELFSIDDKTHQSELREAGARVGQRRAVVSRLEAEAAIQHERTVTMERSRDIAKESLARARNLLADGIGNAAETEAAETILNTAINELTLLKQQLLVYPIRIEEARQELAAAGASEELAEVTLATCRVYAPFTGRVTFNRVHEGQFVTRGDAVMTLADDSVLELPVRLDARDTRQWLRFTDECTSEDVSWFNHPVRAPAKIRWTEDEAQNQWTGVVARVETFDPATRTVTVIVEVPAHQAMHGGGLPLVAGMFCEVKISGKTLYQVVALPQWALTVDGTLRLARDNRLTTVPVSVARREGDIAYVSEGLNPGDLIITTRLINPIEHSLLDVTLETLTAWDSE